MKLCVTAVMFLLLMTLPVCGDIYTWTDENGVMHFTNEPPPIREGVKKQEEIKHDPSQYKEWDEKRKENYNRILESSPSADKNLKKEASPHSKANKSPGKVVMYSTPTCGYCKRARAFFTKNNIGYTEHDITTDKLANQRYRKLNGRGVPLILVGEKRISGFNEGLLRRLLGIK